MTSPTDARAHVSRPEHWPFETAADRAHYDAKRAEGYRLLSQAHALWMEALAKGKANG